MKYLKKHLLRKTIGVLTSVAAFGILQLAVSAGNTSRLTDIKAGLAAALDAPVVASQGDSTSADDDHGGATDDEEEDDEEADLIGSLVMAKVNDSVNVRKEPDENSDKAGKLYADCCGNILEQKNGWTKIESGKLVGWVKDEYLYFGDEAEKQAEEVGNQIATITGTTLRVRKESTEDSDVIGLLAKGDQVLAFDTDDAGWLRIEFEGNDGFISAEFADVEFTLDKGETIEDILAREAAEKAAKEQAEKKKKEEASKKDNSSSKNTGKQTGAKDTENRGAVSVDVDDVTLLAGLIQTEAGSRDYAGLLAVGAVVMNRVRSGGYPNTIQGVIYASGQFPPATNGMLTKRLQNGVASLCMQAAQAAINGESNVGGATHFRRNDGREGIVIGNHVFW